MEYHIIRHSCTEVIYNYSTNKWGVVFPEISWDGIGW